MKTDLNITKRTGHSVPLDIQKIHKVVGFACEGLSGVSSSLVQMNAGIQFADGITSREIQDLLVRSANDLISLDNPNYQYVAARLLLYGIYKDVYGGFDKTPLIEMIKKNIERKVYDSAILESYTEEEFDKMEKYLKHNRDENFTYAGLRQIVDKYLCQDRSSGEIYESPQHMYMMIAATLFANYPKEDRLHYIRRYYDATSLFKINLPILRKPILIAALIVFIDVAKELPLTLILRPFNFDTLATYTYDLINQAQFFQSSLPSLLIIAISFPAIYLINRTTRNEL